MPSFLTQYTVILSKFYKLQSVISIISNFIVKNVFYTKLSPLNVAKTLEYISWFIVNKNFK